MPGNERESDVRRPLTDICDCHAHVVGPLDRFPQIANRNYTAPLAELVSLLTIARTLGVTRFVIVQPSFYGTDNSRLFAALEELEGNGRGVVGIDAIATTASLLDEYARRGVCGVRLNAYSPISRAFSASRSSGLADALRVLGEKLPPNKWHIEIVSSLAALLAVESAIERSPVPIVIDHYGLPGETAPDSSDGRRLLALAQLPHVWIKLSAPYRIGSDPLESAPPTAWLQPLLKAAPTRCIWGSDWPHTPPHSEYRGAEVSLAYRTISYARLITDFTAALPDAATAHRVLIENPAGLYGFAAA